MENIYEKILQIINSSDKVALCTITATKGSTPLKAGAKMLVWKDGKIFGTIGGGSLEKKVIENAIELISVLQPQIYTHELLHQHGMCCGGTVEIFIEPIMNKKKLLIFGAGHIGKSLAKYASDFDFKTTMIDERDEIFDGFHSEEITIANTSHRNFFKSAKFDDNSFVVICTHNHSYDREILAHCLKQPTAYVGMIGSIRKVKVTRKMFLANSVAVEEELDKVDMPIGFDIGGKTPNEIAISILAKLISVKNNCSAEKQIETELENLLEKNCE